MPSLSNKFLPWCVAAAAVSTLMTTNAQANNLNSDTFSTEFRDLSLQYNPDSVIAFSFGKGTLIKYKFFGAPEDKTIGGSCEFKSFALGEKKEVKLFSSEPIRTGSEGWQCEVFVDKPVDRLPREIREARVRVWHSTLVRGFFPSSNDYYMEAADLTLARSADVQTFRLGRGTLIKYRFRGERNTKTIGGSCEFKGEALSRPDVRLFSSEPIRLGSLGWQCEVYVDKPIDKIPQDVRNAYVRVWHSWVDTDVPHAYSERFDVDFADLTYSGHPDDTTAQRFGKGTLLKYRFPGDYRTTIGGSCEFKTAVLAESAGVKIFSSEPIRTNDGGWQCEVFVDKPFEKIPQAILDAAVRVWHFTVDWQ